MSGLKKLQKSSDIPRAITSAILGQLSFTAIVWILMSSAAVQFALSGVTAEALCSSEKGTIEDLGLGRKKAIAASRAPSMLENRQGKNCKMGPCFKDI